jgi:hypothetical protein
MMKNDMLFGFEERLKSVKINVFIGENRNYYLLIIFYKH